MASFSDFRPDVVPFQDMQHGSSQAQIKHSQQNFLQILYDSYLIAEDLNADMRLRELFMCKMNRS